MTCSEGRLMLGNTLRRSIVAALVVCLWLLPVASAHAAPRELGSKAGISAQIYQFGRILLLSVERALGLPFGGGVETTSTGVITDPHGSDGVGIDPNGGGFKP
jgi:hypothetical protein